MQLHIEYINLLYRAMHDLAEMPRTAFGDGEGTARSGVALEMELQPLLQKIASKRAIWTVALRERARMTLRLYALHGNEAAEAATARTGGYTIRVVWPPILPSDRTELVQQETALVAARIHSRRRAMDLLGEGDSDAEWTKVLAEEAQTGVHNMSNRTELLARLRVELGDNTSPNLWSDTLLDDLLIEAGAWYSRAVAPARYSLPGRDCG